MQKRIQYSKLQPITTRHFDLHPTSVAIHLLQYVYLVGIATPHRLGTAIHPCEGHGMAVESYSVLAFSPCATAKNLLPDATPHNPLPRIRLLPYHGPSVV
jgi:hypothetical protein